MDTDCFIVYLKIDDIYEDIAEDDETRFDASNFELARPLPKRKKEKIIGFIKDELEEKIMIKFSGLRAKTYSCLIEGGSKYKNAKDAKKCAIKRKLKFGNYKNFFEATQFENKINYT